MSKKTEKTERNVINELYENNKRRINVAIANAILTEPKLREIVESYIGHPVTDERIKEWRRENTDEPDLPETTPDGGVKMFRRVSNDK